MSAIASGAGAQDHPRYRAVEAFPSLEFRRPIDLQSPRDGSNRLFVAEQDGVVRVFTNRADTRASAVFLDIRDKVNTDGNEMGLLGLAFSPSFATDKSFFVDYTASKWTRRITRVARFRADATGSTAVPASEEVVIEIAQPWSNHNGGQVAFGPDGMLYIAMGDGGSAGDPQGNGQNRAALLGKILRLDVSKRPYAIPADNPFRGNPDGWKEEVWAYGLRNPWRFSFDRETGQLWTGDVGQVTWEEINVIEQGKNYGWDCREGDGPYEPSHERSSACADAGNFVDPVWSYGRTEGISVTGGYVYRGSALPDLVGWYVYADYGTGRVWALRVENGEPENRLLVDTDLMISSFGVDEADELYICAHDYRGEPTKIFKLVAE
ncbi:MAG TPA: PQQ-dependent sugar dehydrogenase [Candidatus Krumholzibacteria bacterium]|nr:PQQ-dependent sugar dehydrogenase [Candidatus Krumholzibacteria bacterium]